MTHTAVTVQDVRRDVLKGKYTVGPHKPQETLLQYAERVHHADAQFRVDCARQFYMEVMASGCDVPGNVYAKGLHLARLAHEEVCGGAIGKDFLARHTRFQYLAQHAYDVDVHVYPLAIAGDLNL